MIDGIPSVIFEIATVADRYHLYFVMVGGAVRDGLLGDSSSSDFDFECGTNIQNLDEDIYRRGLTRFYQEILVTFAVKQESLLFGVERFFLKDGKTIEISPAREEFYGDRTCGHKDFSIKFLLQKNFEKSFLRRDFSINAIGIEFQYENQSFSRLQWVDPFNGRDDLSKKRLRICDGRTFFKDPVRFLRFLRFQLKWNFVVTFKNDIRKFSLRKLSFYHFKRESLKENFFIYYSYFIRTVKEYSLELSPELQRFENLMQSWRWRSKGSIKTIEEVFVLLLICNHLRREDFKNFEELCLLLSLKRKKGRELYNFFYCLQTERPQIIPWVLKNKKFLLDHSEGTLKNKILQILY